jgi:hypothetical protein
MGHPQALLVLILQLLFLLLDLVLIFLLDSLQLVWDDCPDTCAVVSCTKLLFLAITRSVIGRLLDELPEQFNFPLDSVVLEDGAFECAYLVDVAGDGGLRFVQLGLEIGKHRRCGRRRWGRLWRFLVLHRESNGK